MGGLFSSEPPRPRQTTPAYTYGSGLRYGGNGGSRQQPVTEREVLNDAFLKDAVQKFGSLKLEPRLEPRLEPTRRTVPAEKFKVSQRDTGLFRFSYCPVTYTQLNPSDSDYSIIYKLVTHKKCFKIDRIERIDNPFLENAYELKKLQKQWLGCYVQEKLLFHGTKQCLVDEICTFNFDYRKTVKHKYGKGVSFSTNSTYASNYSDQNVYNKVMLVAKVLIVNSCIGNAHMIVPPDGYDTTTKGLDGVVTVKYEDNEYRPAFKIHYHTVGEMNHQQQHQRGRRKPKHSPAIYSDLY